MCQTMKCDILTLFPDTVEAVLSASILGRAREKGLLEVRAVNLRDYAEGRHKVADDYPYGGGAGMVIKPEPVFRAVEDLRARHGEDRKSTLLNSSHSQISYAVFCLK